MGGIAPEDRSIARHVGAMESEDLLRMADLLGELRADPRFVKLGELMGIEVEQLRRRMEIGSLDTVQAYAHSNGVIRGLRLPGQIIDNVLDTARRVRAQLEGEG